MLLYGGGVAACRRGQYNTLTGLLASGSVTDHFEGKKRRRRRRGREDDGLVGSRQHASEAARRHRPSRNGLTSSGWFTRPPPSVGKRVRRDVIAEQGLRRRSDGLLAAGDLDSCAVTTPFVLGVHAVNPARIVSNELSESAFGQVFGGRGFYRVSNRLSQVLRDPFRSLLAQDADYDDAFDRFEYLLALVYADIAYGPRSLDNGIVPAWVPVGCVRSGKQEVFEEMTAEASVAGENWPPLKAGLFGGEIARFTKALRVLHDVYGRHERAMWT